MSAAIVPGPAITANNVKMQESETNKERKQRTRGGIRGMHVRRLSGSGYGKDKQHNDIQQAQDFREAVPHVDFE
ncbi:hypothetical protein E2C01_023216 [Portunus trituberculatus]|uniref:Uncharacterized protein n=1 Tax=Portunus trituberculatus TaxID=210409 RepID=A0A5B7E7E9_PORTR|nr:hypothetical protein [Portunus trituberculatus]